MRPYRLFWPRQSSSAFLRQGLAVRNTELIGSCTYVAQKILMLYKKKILCSGWHKRGRERGRKCPNRPEGIMQCAPMAMCPLPVGHSHDRTGPDRPTCASHAPASALLAPNVPSSPVLYYSSE
jgi:hypothetical protein